jgi:hypothetical protein
MNYLKGKGAPGRKLQAAIGDIYTDINTGEQYKCIFSYKNSLDEKYDTTWDKTGDVVPVPLNEVDDNEVVEEESLVETEEAPAKESNEEKPQKNYAGYSKKKNPDNK